jgi:hypothetical protein
VSFLTPLIPQALVVTRYVDALTGEELEPGCEIRFPAERDENGALLPREGYEVLQLTSGWFSGAAFVKLIGGEQDGQRRWVPLVVRRFHPSYLFQKVAFFPS